MRRSGLRPTPPLYPHPNKLPRWLYRLLLISGALLLLSGLAWEALHYTLGAGREALALPHPGEAWLMRLHGLVMLGFVLALGALGPVHIPRGWREKRNLYSGIALLLLAFGLLLSAYLLYYWAADNLREPLGLTHTLLGVAMAALVLWHRTAQRR